MNYKQFKDIKLSQLGMGAMRLPVLEEGKQAIDYEKGQEVIDYAYSHGINYYDTAYIYHDGESEVFLGKALSKYPRDSFYIADKFKISANPDYKAQFADQLRRLNVEYIDFYLLHGLADNNYKRVLECGAVEYFKELKEKGIIKYFGFSFHGNPNVLREIVSQYDFDFVQIQLNYYDWYYGTAKEQYEILSEHKLPIMVMEPVHGGMLANLNEEAGKVLSDVNDEVSYASWALRFVRDLDSVCVTLSGMSNMDQIIDNVKTFEDNTPLNERELKAIEESCSKTQESIGVVCTGCRYCVEHCPMGLDIPYLLRLYNEYKLGGTWRLARLKGEDPAKLPSVCISCGVCTSLCPQSIKAYEYLREIADDFETL